MIGSPPPELLDVAIDAAIAAARMSPCAKSKRGCAVFDPDSMATVIGAGYNGQPPPWKCEGRCRIRERTHDVSACSMLCVHAEARAIRAAVAALSSYQHACVTLAGFDLVHIKVNDHGEPVPSGGPSCWQCSREIVDVGLDGVWLLQGDDHPRIHHVSINSGGDLEPAFSRRLPFWRRYTAEEFHTETMLACELIAARPPEAP